MTSTVDRLMKELAALEVADRVAVYHFLEDTLPDVALEAKLLAEEDAAMEAELDRRYAEIVSGNAVGVSSEELRAKLLARRK